MYFQKPLAISYEYIICSLKRSFQVYFRHSLPLVIRPTYISSKLLQDKESTDLSEGHKSAGHKYNIYMSRKTGLASLAHLKTDWISLTNPVSLGFSRPRRSRFFITDTNSRLLNCPSTTNHYLIISFSFIIFKLKMIVGGFCQQE